MHLKGLLRILLIGSEKQSNVKSPSNYKIILFLFASLFVIVHSSDYKAVRRSTKVQRLQTNFRGVDAPHFNQPNRAVNDNLKKTSSIEKKNKQQVNKDKMLYNDSEKINKAIEYTINEENKVPYYLGNVPRDAQLTDPTISSSKAVHGSTTQSLLRYHFRPVPRTSSKSYHVEDYFKLNATTGDLYIFVVLDRDELCPQHNERPASLASSLIISSTRSSSCSLTFDIVVKPIDYIKIVKITVNLLDLNDNAPRFQKNRTTIEVAESSSLGYFLHLPSAEDHDTGINGIQEYQLVSAYNEFELVAADQIDDSIDVLLKLVSKLDREVCDHYEVTLIAIDGGRPAKSGFIDIEIKVIDSNDNPPVFEKSSYSVTVLESTLPGTTLLTVHATDKDVGANAHITYLLSPNSDHAYGDVFQIDGHSGEILITKPLDYETNRYYRLTVLAKNDDNLVHLLTSTVTVEVFVEDVNDNPPVISVNFWPHRTHAEVMENIGPDVFVALITVKDADSGKSGAFTCSVEGTSLFRLVPVYSQEFKLLTNQVFDREEQDLHSMTVTCADHGEDVLSSSRPIQVRIADDNDNAPTFSDQINNNLMTNVPNNTPINPRIIKIPENKEKNSVLAVFHASDADVGRNAEVRYTLKQVLHTSPNVQHASENRNNNNNNNMRDYSNAQSDNDKTLPTPANNITYQYGGPNDNNQDNKIAPVNAYNGLQLVQCDTFSIHQTTGILTNLMSFDFEENENVYELMIISSDEGTPSLSSSLSFIVYIFDLNDNPPMFGKQKNYYFSIPENSPAEAVVGFVSATDDDSSPEFKTIEYFLHDPSECFQINKRTGEIRSLVSFDRESTAVYKLIVTAENNLMRDNSFIATGLKHRSKKLSASVNVTVSISDVNDNAPVFVFPNISFYEVEVAKNVANSVGSVVARVQAVDPDNGKNAAVRYEIVYGNEDNKLNVDPITGVIYVLKPLQRTSKYTFKTDEHETSRNNSTSSTELKHNDKLHKAQNSNSPSERANLIEFDTKSVYHLVLKASDSGSPNKSVTGNLVIKISNSSASRENVFLSNVSAAAASGGLTSLMITIASSIIGGFLIMSCFIWGLVIVCRMMRKRRLGGRHDASIYSKNYQMNSMDSLNQMSKSMKDVELDRSVRSLNVNQSYKNKNDEEDTRRSLPNLRRNTDLSNVLLTQLTLNQNKLLKCSSSCCMKTRRKRHVNKFESLDRKKNYIDYKDDDAEYAGDAEERERATDNNCHNNNNINSNNIISNSYNNSNNNTDVILYTVPSTTKCPSNIATTGMERNENLLSIKCTCHSDLTGRSNSQTATPLWKMQKMRRNVLKSDGSGIESDSSYSDSGRGLSEDERFKQINRNKISSISLMTPMNGLCKVSTADVLAVHEVLCANNNRHLKNQNVQVPSNTFVHQDPNDLQQVNEKNRFHRTLLNRINEKQDAVVSRQDAVVSRPSPTRLDSTERKSHPPSNDSTIRRNWSVAASEV